MLVGPGNTRLMGLGAQQTLLGTSQSQVSCCCKVLLEEVVRTRQGPLPQEGGTARTGHPESSAPPYGSRGRMAAKVAEPSEEHRRAPTSAWGWHVEQGMAALRRGGYGGLPTGIGVFDDGESATRAWPEHRHMTQRAKNAFPSRGRRPARRSITPGAAKLMASRVFSANASTWDRALRLNNARTRSGDRALYTACAASTPPHSQWGKTQGPYTRAACEYGNGDLVAAGTARARWKPSERRTVDVYSADCPDQPDGQSQPQTR